MRLVEFIAELNMDRREKQIVDGVEEQSENDRSENRKNGLIEPTDNGLYHSIKYNSKW